jgi:hypothetical protein
MNINKKINNTGADLLSTGITDRALEFIRVFLSAAGRTVKTIFENTGLARKMAIGAACAMFLGVFAHSVSAAEINGYYEGDDGGAYFVRQIGDKIYWFGENPNGSYANVLAGTVSGGKIIASFWDVPKGKSKGAGEIVFEIQAGGATLSKVSSTVPFGMKVLKKAVISTVVVGVPMIKGEPDQIKFDGFDNLFAGFRL